MLDFSHAGDPMSFEVIPDGTLCLCHITLRGNNPNQGQFHKTRRNGGRYLDCELEVVTGKYKGRKLFENVVLDNPENDRAAHFGDACIKAMLAADAVLAGRDLNQPGAFSINHYGDLQTKTVAVKVKVEAPEEYTDQRTGEVKTSKERNRVGTWISPIAQSTAELWTRLMEENGRSNIGGQPQPLPNAGVQLQPPVQASQAPTYAYPAGTSPLETNQIPDAFPAQGNGQPPAGHPAGEPAPAVYPHQQAQQPQAAPPQAPNLAHPQVTTPSGVGGPPQAFTQGRKQWRQ